MSEPLNYSLNFLSFCWSSKNKQQLEILCLENKVLNINLLLFIE